MRETVVYEFPKLEYAEEFVRKAAPLFGWVDARIERAEHVWQVTCVFDDGDPTTWQRETLEAVL